MKIAIIGGSGLIGTKLARRLRDREHDVVATSLRSGVNAVTGEGLAAAVTGADVAVDVLNSPSFEDAAVLRFFEATSQNLLAAEKAAGVKHHVALSIVGTDRLPQSGYFRAKAAQERLIKASGVPYTIVRATQFFEFLDAIAGSAADGQAARLPSALFQPMAADDVAGFLADVATQPPLNATIDVAGPEPIGMDEAVRLAFAAKRDPRPVITDARAGYFGSPIDDQSLRPLGKARLGATRLRDWLAAAGG